MTTPDKKADFSGVQSGVQSTEQFSQKADFSDVQGSVSSTEEITGGSGGGGGGGQQSYTVAKGDTLSAIAQQFYGKASHWHAIYDANRDQLNDPDKIQPGQVLKIPANNA